MKVFGKGHAQRLLVAACAAAVASLGAVAMADLVPSKPLDAAKAQAESHQAELDAALTPEEQVKKILGEGSSGNFKFEETCQKSVKNPSATVKAGELEQYVKENDKKIMDSNPTADPVKSASQIASTLNAATALVCQAKGMSGKKTGKTEEEAWQKVLGDKKFWKPEAAGAAVTDYGFLLQKDGEHAKAIPVLEAAGKIDPTNELAFLYLANSQWVTKQKPKAKKNYKMYMEIRTAKYGPHGTPAAYVDERLKEK